MKSFFLRKNNKNVTSLFQISCNLIWRQKNILIEKNYDKKEMLKILVKNEWNIAKKIKQAEETQNKLKHPLVSLMI